VTGDAKDVLFGLTEQLPASGKHMGFVKIPHSSDRSAYGIVPVPLAIVGGSAGPTILLLAGVFGDEIDAQIAVAGWTQPQQVISGRRFRYPDKHHRRLHRAQSDACVRSGHRPAQSGSYNAVYVQRNPH
jgi:hypothetical protein